MSAPRRNAIVTVYGPKGSGKSRFLSDLVARVPRVLTLDITGEAREVYPSALGPFFGLRDTLAALHRAAHFPGWHVIAALDDAEVPALFARLVPRYDGRTRPLAAALGGIAVECGEVDMIAPSGRTPPEVLSAWRRGRHAGLSLFTATQRPAAAARDVSAQADVIASFQVSEPRDVAFIADMMGSAAAEAVQTLPPYHAAVYTRRLAAVALLDENRRAYRWLSLRGDVLEDAPA